MYHDFSYKDHFEINPLQKNQAAMVFTFLLTVALIMHTKHKNHNFPIY